MPGPSEGEAKEAKLQCCRPSSVSILKQGSQFRPSCRDEPPSQLKIQWAKGHEE